MNKQVISLAESKRLTQLEKVIKDGEQTFMEVGKAIVEIRDKKLYRSEFETFELYCQTTWGWSASRARQLGIASETAKALPMVTNERAARALSKVPPPARKGIVQKIVSAGQKVTAAAVAKLAPKPRQKPTTGFLDAIGRNVPPECVKLWERAHEAQAILSMLSDIRGTLRKAQSETDKLFVEVDFTANLAHLNQVYLDMEQAKPYALCPTCSGINFQGCLTCNERGFVSKFYYEHKVSQETKDIILKSMEK